MKLPTFEQVDRHYPAIISASVIGLVGSAGAVTYALRLNAAEFLGLSALAIVIAFTLDHRLHGEAWRQRRSRDIAALQRRRNGGR